MINLMLEGDGILVAILLIIFLVFGVPLILVIAGVLMRKKNKKTSKILLIIAAVYTIIGLGVCGTFVK